VTDPTTDTDDAFSPAFSPAYDAQTYAAEPSGCGPAASCWDTDWSCADKDFYDGLDPAVIRRAESLAWSTIRSLSAYQVGQCPTTVRPCARRCLGPSTWWQTGRSLLNPQVIDGNWVNTSCGCKTPCSCSYVPTVVLPGPVGRVDEVIVDGVVLDPLSYRIDNGNELVRTDGQDWPMCQDMAAACGEPGSFCVTYVRGAVPDELGCWVAGMLAQEFAKACTGGKCRLPAGVTQVTRQGVSFTIGTGPFPGGVTGIREVDAYIELFNPNHLTQAPTVWSPDLGRTRRTTWAAVTS
jgi:hypothetical protein